MTPDGITGRRRRAAFLQLLLTLLGSGSAALLAGCTSETPGDAPPGVPVSMVFVEGEASAPKLVEGVCVVHTPRLSAEEARAYHRDPAMAVFVHVGRSLKACMAGEADAEAGPLPLGFFGARLWINHDGVCQPGAVACYKPENPTIDRKQAFPPEIQRPDWYEPSLVGHETWHAYAGSFHDI